MGIDYFVCTECQEIGIDNGEHPRCACCNAVAHSWCVDEWKVATKKGKRVCTECTTVDVGDDEVFKELLRLYRLLPGHDESLDADTVRLRLSQGRKTEYEKAIEDGDGPCDDDDEWLSGKEEAEEERPSSSPKRARTDE